MAALKLARGAAVAGLGLSATGFSLNALMVPARSARLSGRVPRPIAPDSPAAGHVLSSHNSPPSRQAGNPGLSNLITAARIWGLVSVLQVLRARYRRGRARGPQSAS